MLFQARKTVFWQFLYPEKSVSCTVMSKYNWKICK